MEIKQDNRNRTRRIRFIFAICALFSITIGCSLKNGKTDSWQPIEKKDMPVVHVVRYPKETLPIIAKWYTGDSRKWELLAVANPNINPDHLCAGNEVFIPDSLVKTRDPMPREFVVKFYQKPKRKKRTRKIRNTSPVRPEKKEDEFEIFGPK